MRYENTVCDGCKKRFEESDDVVVCPVCGTPQHRECYEKNGECVNAALHESGFMWHGEVSSPHNIHHEEEKVHQGENLVCPACGHENPPGSQFCEVCKQKFTFFGINILEKETRLTKEIDEEEKIEEEMRDVQNTIESGMGTGADIERMIDARAKIVAPGLSKEQEQEVLCSNPIKRVLVFISSNAVAYVNKFRKTESSGKNTWNWAAFFFSPFWFFYRKLYKVGSIFLTIRLALSIVALPFSAKFYSLAQELSIALKDSSYALSSDIFDSSTVFYDLIEAAIPLYVICGLTILLSIVSGAIGDRIYKKYVTQKLNESNQISDPLVFSHFFLKNSGVNVLAALVSFTVAYLVPNLLAQFFM